MTMPELDLTTAVNAAAKTLRDIAPGHPAVRIWGRGDGHDTSSLVVEGNVWAGDPDDIAKIVLAAALPSLVPRVVENIAGILNSLGTVLQSKSQSFESGYKAAIDDAVNAARKYARGES